MKERLQKIMAAAGIASRRECEEIIKQGRVTVNGKIITIGDSADIKKDKILVDNKKISRREPMYVMLHKPKWYVTTLKDSYAKKTIVNLLPDDFINQKIYHVGRLDKDAEGLLLLTNDGNFANKIMHPRYEVRKTYRCWLDSKFKNEHLKVIRKGIKLDDGFVKNIRIRPVSHTCVDITLHVGKHKIVKRIFKKLGYRILRLSRLKIGNLELGRLKQGEYKIIGKPQIAKIFNQK